MYGAILIKFGNIYSMFILRQAQLQKEPLMRDDILVSHSELVEERLSESMYSGNKSDNMDLFL